MYHFIWFKSIVKHDFGNSFTAWSLPGKFGIIEGFRPWIGKWMEVIHWPGRRRRNVGEWHCQRFKTVGIKYWHWTGQARTNLFREANSLDRKELACIVFLRESCTKRINQWFYFVVCLNVLCLLSGVCFIRRYYHHFSRVCMNVSS